MFKFDKNYKNLKQVKAFYPQFLKQYEAIKKNGSYPYNYLFEGKIKGIDGEDEKTAIYLLQCLKDEIEKNNYETKMIAEGWEKLTEETIKKALEEKKKIAINAKHTKDFMTFKVDKIMKPALFNGKNYGLMELRAKSRGYSLYQFEDAFCKLV